MNFIKRKRFNLSFSIQIKNIRLKKTYTKLNSLATPNMNAATITSPTNPATVAVVPEIRGVPLTV